MWKGIKRMLTGMCALLALLCVCAATVLGLQGYEMFRRALREKPLAQAVAEVRAQPDFTPFDELPALYREAVVAVEDHRFYTHGGVDLIAVCRALLHDIQAGSLVEGGSTITQQLAKNLYFTQEKRITRKIAELFAAWELEAHYTKQEILELYVNAIYFGGGCENVRQASRHYFDKEPAQMTPYECTMLAGIPNAPSAYDPLRYPALAEQRQRQVVRQMERQGCLSGARVRELLPAE